MTPINDGGPAFPRPYSDNTYGDRPEYGQEGMSLRDWFAGQVLSMAAHDLILPTQAAERAYAIADAMIKEREVS